MLTLSPAPVGPRGRPSTAHVITTASAIVALAALSSACRERPRSGGTDVAPGTPAPIEQQMLQVGVGADRYLTELPSRPKRLSSRFSAARKARRFSSPVRSSVTDSRVAVSWRSTFSIERAA